MATPVDLSALNQNIGEAWSRILDNAFDIPNGGGMNNDLKALGSEGSTSYFHWDYSLDKCFIQRTTTDTDPGRLLYIQHLTSAVASGSSCQGLQIRSRATGTGTIAGGCDGAEIKAGLNSDSDTGTLAQARAVIANVDAKKGTITTAYCVEASADIGAGGTFTTLVGFRAFLNNSGTVTDGYAFYVDAVSGYPWEYGFYVESGMATKPFYAAASASGTTSFNLMDLQVTDTMTAASGYQRGLYINWTNTGDRTGTAEINGLGIDMALQGNVPYAYGISLYCNSSGNPTIGQFNGISTYFEDLGSACTSFFGVEVGVAFTNQPTNSAFFRAANHGNGLMGAIFDIRGQAAQEAATYLFDFSTNTTGPCVADTGATGDNATYKIKCRHNGTTFYLAGFADF